MSKENKLIEETAQVTAKAVVLELKRQGLMKDSKPTPFQKTETLLYNYNSFASAILDKYLQIETIQSEGLQKKSNSVTSFSGQGVYDIKNDSEKAEEKIEAIEKSIQITKNFINVIDSALKVLEDDPYFDIIQMKYFDGKSREEIAEYYSVDVSTISRNKNKLINSLQIRLFSDEVIGQIFS